MDEKKFLAVCTNYPQLLLGSVFHLGRIGYNKCSYLLVSSVYKFMFLTKAHAKAKELLSKTAIQYRILYSSFQKMHSNL